MALTIVYRVKDMPLFCMNLTQLLKNEENANQSPESFLNITIYEFDSLGKAKNLILIQRPHGVAIEILHFDKLVDT